MNRNDELARVAEGIVSCLEATDLSGACRLAQPWVNRCRSRSPVYTRCDLDGSPPALTPHHADPLPRQGVRLFSTADPPEIACDIMLLSAAPPTREAWLLDNGEVALLLWRFSSEGGLLQVHCQADVDQRPAPEHDFGVYQNQAISALPGLILEGMSTDPAADTFLRTDVRALPLLIACTKAGVRLSLAADYLLYHVSLDAAHDDEIVRALTMLSPAVLRDLVPRIDRNRLRDAVERSLLEQLEQPRSWMEPRLSERLALFSRPALDQRAVDILSNQSAPWIAWWLLAQAMESAGSRSTARRLACGALDKLPTSMKTIELLERCGDPEAATAVAQAVAWMRRENWHQLDLAEQILYRMCRREQADALVQAAEQALEQSMQSRVHSPQ